MGGAIAQLSTEARAAGLEDLDRRHSADVVRAVASGHHDVVEAVLGAAEAIGALADAAAERLGRGGRVFYVGAGAAGRTATVDASEWAPTSGAGARVRMT